MHNLTLIVCILGTLLGQVLPPQQPQTMRPDEAKGCDAALGFIGIAGDSRSTPLLPHSDWPGAMSTLLRSTNSSLLNLALGGSVATSDTNVGWPVERTGPWQVQALIDAEVDLIVIAFGVNDINNEGHTAVQVFSDLSVLVGMCEAASIPFVVATVEFMHPPHLVGNNHIVNDLNNFLQTSGWPLIDFATIANDPSYTDDGLHTNELGRLVKARFATDVFCEIR